MLSVFCEGFGIWSHTLCIIVSMFANSEFDFSSINELSGRCEEIRLMSPPIIDYIQQNSLSTAKNIYQQYGFLIVKNFLPQSALTPLLDRLTEEVRKLGYQSNDGRLLTKQSVCLSGYRPITDCEHYKKLIETISESKLFGELFGQAQCEPLETKYLTGLGPRHDVALHCDYYRLKAHASQPVFTTWLPLSHLDIKSGTFVAGSRYSPEQLQDEVNGRELPKAFLEDLCSPVFYYCSLSPGDLILLDVNIVYGTFRNDLGVVSLHSDVKWIAHKPVFQFSAE